MHYICFEFDVVAVPFIGNSKYQHLIDNLEVIVMSEVTMSVQCVIDFTN